MGPWDCFGRHVGPRAFPNPRYSTLEKPRGPSAIECRSPCRVRALALDHLLDFCAVSSLSCAFAV